VSEVRGLVEYPVTDTPTQLFPELANGMTLYLSEDSPRIWVGTTASVRPGVGLPMNPLASVAWDRGKPMYACTEGPGLRATLIGIDLQASVNDPTLLASLISGGTVDATAIANAIAASGLTSPGIAAAILAGGLTPTNIAAAIAAEVLDTTINGTVSLSPATLAALETINAVVAGTVALDAPTLAALESITAAVTGTVALDAPTLAALETVNVLGPLTDAQLRAAAVPVKQVKDTGRTLLVLSLSTAAPTVADTLANVTPITAGVAAGAAGSFAIPAGKVLRILDITASVRTTTAATPWAKVVLRMNPAGAAVVGSPVVCSLGVGGSAAVIGNTGNAQLAIPGGVEFSGAQQVGVSVSGNVNTNVLDVTLIGYLYTP
jgi:hypothetical protein